MSVTLFELRGRDMEIRYYDSAQVLQWWREYTWGDRGDARAEPARIGPVGYKPAVQSDPVSHGVDLDRRHLAWLHVERFFTRHFEWAASKPLLLMGEATDCLAAFGAWYERNPMMHVSDHVGSGGTVHCPEVVPYLLAEALERYNATAKPVKQRGITAVREAIRQGRLYAWRPDGRWTTTIGDIERWVASDDRLQKMEVA